MQMAGVVVSTGPKWAEGLAHAVIRGQFTARRNPRFPPQAGTTVARTSKLSTCFPRLRLFASPRRPLRFPPFYLLISTFRVMPPPPGNADPQVGPENARRPPPPRKSEPREVRRTLHSN